MMNAASNATDDDDEEVTIVREPRDGLGRHTRRRGREEASSPTERDGSERSATWTSGTDMEPRYHRPCSDLRRYALARVHRNQRNGARQQALHAHRAFVHSVPCRSINTPRALEARPGHSVLCGPTSTLASTSRRIRFNLAKRKHTHGRGQPRFFCFWFLSSLFFLVFFELPRFLFSCHVLTCLGMFACGN